MTRNSLYKRVRKRISTDGERCAECGSSSFLQRHHPDHRNEMDVVILCRKCHGRVSANHRWRSQDWIRTCGHCGKSFERKRSRQSFCSASCAHKQAWIARKATR